jgi:DNA-binding NarL/FixJ family response regulator
MIRVFLTDDHAIVREGLKRVLSDAPGIEVIGEASNGHEALDRLRSVKPDVMVLDLNMPGRGGLETLREIRDQYPKIRVLVLSMHPEDQFALRVLREGARGYLNKGSAAEDLVPAVLKIAAGGTWVSPALTERMVEVIGGKNEEQHEKLSSREFEVLRALARGRTVSEIAGDLFLSVKTVSTYRTRILEKMQLRTTAELMHYAIERGLVD